METRPEEQVLVAQAGVVRRAQLIAVGRSPSEIRRLLRRRELAVAHPGVYVDHTGALAWSQRAWAAVLACWPAALSHESALRAANGPGRRDRDDDQLIHVAIAEARRIVAPHGVVVHRLVHFERRVQWNYSPPRVRYEDAALDVAIDTVDQMAAIAALADAVQSRRTTARRLIESLDQRARTPGRRWIRSVLCDIAEGTCSVPERGYATKVERPHGLPRAVRQQRTATSTGVIYRDATCGQVVLELDGRLFHDTASGRDRDMERDLDAAIAGLTTARLGWGQVFGRPCVTAAKVATLLKARGVAVEVRACGPACLSGGLVPPGDTNPPDKAA